MFSANCNRADFPFCLFKPETIEVVINFLPENIHKLVVMYTQTRRTGKDKNTVANLYLFQLWFIKIT